MTLRTLFALGIAWSLAACSSPSGGELDAGPDGPASDAPASDAPMIDAPIDAGPDAADDPLRWARAWDSPGMLDQIYGIAVGPDQGVVVVGVFEGSISPGGALLTSAGGRDGFVVKLDAAGQVRWALPLGSTSGDYTGAVAVDDSGAVYVTGEFRGTLDVDGEVLTSGTFQSQYLLKLDATTGHRIWAVRAGEYLAPILALEYQGLTVSGDGATIALTTPFYGAVNFGGADLPSADPSRRDIVVAVYNSDGAPRWSRRFGAESDDISYAIAMAGPDRIVVGGQFSDTVDFGGTPLATRGLPQDSGDAFLACYDAADGAHVWSSSYGSPFYGDSVRTIAADANFVYAGGSFVDVADFGAGQAASQGGFDGWLGKYATATGAPQWANAFGGESGDGVLGLAIRGNDLTFIGRFVDVATVGQFTMTSAGSVDLMWGSVDHSTGLFGQPQQAGGPSVDTPTGTAVTATSVWIGGIYGGAATIFGSPLPAPGPFGGSFVGRTPR